MSVFHIQNVSQEPQLVRVMGEKRVVNPGEVAEVLEAELGVTKTYKTLFKRVDPLNPYTVELKKEEAPQTGSADPYEALKQPELKAELDKRGIEYPKGSVKNDVLKDLLRADDVKKATPEAPKADEVKTEEAPKTPETEQAPQTGSEQAPESAQTQSSIAE